MKYCKRCVQPDTRPGIEFDENGVCAACLYAESVKNINWKAREKEAKEIVEWAKKKAKESKSGYDCVIGVSGGKDSTVQALWARKMGLNPLLVNGMPEGITEVGAHNIDNISWLGFDMIKIRPDPNVMKQLFKRDFYKYLNPIKVTEYPLWNSTYWITRAFKIPLILQGDNDGLTLGAVKEMIDAGGDAANVYDNATLAGGDAIAEYGKEVDPKKLVMYQFAKKDVLDKEGIKAIYVQYYDKDWSSRRNAEIALKHGLKTRTDDLHELGRVNHFCALDSDMQMPNQMFKYLKFGFGFATDEVNEDIQQGRITRKEGIKLVKEYDGKCGKKYIKKFCDYIDIDEKEFWRVVDQFVNKKLFKKNPKTGEWEPKFEVGVDFDEEKGVSVKS